jgi:hypothetical protein
MPNKRHRAERELPCPRIRGLAGCIAALILTLLPAFSTHHFSPCYRPIEVCQNAARL